MVVKDFPQLFWDVDPAGVDPVRHKTYIIERVLEEGTMESLGALFSDYSRDEIVEVIRTSPRLSRRTANFWRIYLDIQEPIACLQKPSTPGPAQLWMS